MRGKLKILVCINQLFHYQHPPSKRFNMADRCALEEALQIKEQLENVEISAVLFGAPEAKWILNACLGFGVEQATHFIINPAEYYDANTIALALSRHISGQQFDLIFCSYQDENGNFQVGPAGSILAELLQYPYLSEVASLTIDLPNSSVTVKRKQTKGNRLQVRTSFPAVLSVSKVINEPRYISLRRQKTLSEKRINKINLNKEALLEPAQLTMLVSVGPFRPRPKQIPLAGGNLTVHERLDFIISGGNITKRKSRLLEGNPLELSNNLLSYMVEENIL